MVLIPTKTTEPSRVAVVGRVQRDVARSINITWRLSLHPSLDRKLVSCHACIGSTSKTRTVPTASIAAGLQVSKVIKGCWQLDGHHRGDPSTDHTSGDVVAEDFEAFASAGITTFDTADHYGPAEMAVGEFFRRHPERLGQCQVLTKLCVFDPVEMLYISRSSVRKALSRARGRTRKGTLSLVQLHWQDVSRRRYLDAALYLQELKQEGWLTHIGVTNFDTRRLQRLLDNGVEVVSNQVAYSVLDRRPESFMTDFCTRNGISLLPYGVLAGGFLADSMGLVDTASKKKYLATIEQAGGWPFLQRVLTELQCVGVKHGVPLASVAARWVLQRPAVPAIILGARNTQHLQEQCGLFGFELDADDVGRISEVLVTGTASRGDCYTWERGGVW